MTGPKFRKKGKGEKGKKVVGWVELREPHQDRATLFMDFVSLWLRERKLDSHKGTETRRCRGSLSWIAA